MKRDIIGAIVKGIVVALLIILGVMVYHDCFADSVWVLCQPDSFVNVREFPKLKAKECGWCELGDELETDGIKRNGFIHVLGFEGDGWIYAGYVIDEPVIVGEVRTEIRSKGRVAARRYIKGKRRKWLKDGAEVTVYGYSDSWAVTDQGFIQTQYLGVF